MAEPKLIRIAIFDDPNLAQIAKMHLEREGVRAFLEGDNYIATDWMMTNAAGGIKLLIKDTDIDAALAILKQKTGELDEAEIEKYLLFQENPNACPSCGSKEIYKERLRRRWIFLSILLLGFPLAFLGTKMTCSDCRHQW